MPKKSRKKPKKTNKAFKKQVKTSSDNSRLLIPAGLFIGLGAGFLLSNITVGLLLGLGLGILARYLAKRR
jgi:hypothetical protein